MSNPMFRRFLIFGASALLAGCAGMSPAPEPPPVEPHTAATAVPELEIPERPIPSEHLYPLLLAEFALRRREYDVALDNYMSLAQALDDPGVRAHATHLAQFMNREPEALEAASLWIEVDPDNLEANNAMASLLSRRGQPVAALPYMAKLARADIAPRYSLLLTNYRQLTPEEQAQLAAGIAALAEEFPQDPQLILTQALLLEEQGQTGEALNKTREIFPYEPYQDQGVLLEAKLMLDTGAEDPFARMRAALEADPHNKRLRLQYARLLTRTDMNEARNQFEILSAQSPKDADALFSLALINREMGDDLAAKAYLRQLIELDQRASEAQYYLGRIAEEDKDLSTAVSHYQQVTDGSDFFAATSRIGRIYIEDNRFGELHSYLNDLRSRYPERRAQLYALEVDLLAKIGQLDIAMSLLNQALEEYPESTSLRYTRSMLWEQQDQIQAMESDLRTIIEREPENATALNALGYSLANRTSRFDEAYELITRALELQPDEPAILDSMGWVHYRMGNYEEALNYLARAYVQFPDPEVAAHLGEVLWVTGDTQKARDVWRGALMRDPTHEVLVDTLKRLNVPPLTQ